MENALLTALEVAEILKIKKTTVYELIKRGELPSKKVGKQLRVAEKDVLTYLNMSETPTAQSFTEAEREQSLYDLRSDKIVLCGQDITLDIIANYINTQPDLPYMLRSQMGSYNSLNSLYQGKADIATSHLWDESSKLYNYTYIPRIVPGLPLIVVRLFGRTQGFYVKKGNPKAIRGWEDLRRSDISIVNREKGSGTRVLLDEKLKAMKIVRHSLGGYEHEASSHLTVAAAVARGEGDFGLGCEQGCRQVSSLEFIPLQNEWYDLVFLSDMKESKPYSVVLDYICSEHFFTELSSIGGYDISQTGKIVRL